MTPLGCRGTQERRRQGLWRILAEMGIGSKIYKFIHQKAVFLCHQCVHLWVRAGGSAWMWVRQAQKERDEREEAVESLIVSTVCELKHQATGNNRYEKNCISVIMLSSLSAFSLFSPCNSVMDILTIINKSSGRCALTPFLSMYCMLSLRLWRLHTGQCVIFSHWINGHHWVPCERWQGDEWLQCLWDKVQELLSVTIGERINDDNLVAKGNHKRLRKSHLEH